MLNSKKMRPIFTLAFVMAGGFAGNSVASWWLRRLDRYLAGDTSNFLWLIPQNPTQLSSSDKAILQALGLLVGALLGFVIERLAFSEIAQTRLKWKTMTAQDKIVMGTGLLLGLIFTVLFSIILKTATWVNAAAAVILCYMCVVALDSMKEQLRFYFPSSFPTIKEDRRGGYRAKILDTNVIIDGRIADVCRAGFVEGPIYVPKFVLEELQQIADSSDSLKRARGRRGLDILKQMQKEMELEVPDFAADDANEEVDSRLVLVARDIGGAIITNDFNLNKVAELQGVTVLNVNELANALKPVVLPGEEMQVTIIKEGKEKDQGIGYLDDGTMIVVEGGRRLMGETMQVNVTSVLQTVQGKMIFAKVRENGDTGQGSESIDDGIRSYTSSRARRKIR